MWINAFSTGTHQDFYGKTWTFTREHIDSVVRNLDPEKRKPPIVKGHPEHDAPAFGWVQAAKRSGDTLMLKLGEITDEMVDQVKRGLFKYCSPCFSQNDDGTFTLSHLGFLGAWNPAVEGLGELQAQLKFGAPGKGAVFAFGDYRLNIVAQLFHRLRDRLIEKDGLEAADQILNPYLLEELGKDPDTHKMPYGRAEKGIPMTPEETAEMARLQADIARLTTENATLTGKVTGLEEEKKTAAFAAQRTADKTFLDSLGTKVLPAEHDAVLDMMASLRKAEPIAFGAAGTKTPAVDLFKGVLASRPEGLSLAEVATKDKAAPAEAGAKLEQLAFAKMAGDKSLTFGTALQAVQVENPDLAKAYAAEVRS